MSKKYFTVERPSHILRENKGSAIPSRFIFFDVETKQVQVEAKKIRHDFYFGYACYWRREGNRQPEIIDWQYFDNIGDFWDWLTSKFDRKTRLILIGHNVNFDFSLVEGFNTLFTLDFKLTKFFESESMFYAAFKRKGQSVIVIDNMNFFKSSLKVLGENVGLEKLEVDFKTVKINDFRSYCKRDVEILLFTWQNYVKFLGDEDLGCFGITLPSQALNAYRHRFMKHKIYIHSDVEAINFERSSYHGGRTEAFKLGNFKGDMFYYLDVNSLYPYVMKLYPYPTKFLGFKALYTVSELVEVIKDYCLIADVLVESYERVFSVVYNNKLVFPIGTLRLTLTTPELEYAIKNNLIKSIYKVAVYEREPIFRYYVDYIYNKRKEAMLKDDDVYATFFKYLLNTLYGKFGQYSGEFEDLEDADDIDYKCWQGYHETYKRWVTIRQIGNKVQVSSILKESYNSFPAIASHVTAYARMCLYTYMLKSGLDNVYYCDTDSLFVNKAGYNNLSLYINENQLGKMKVVKTSDNMTIYGCKDYQFGDMIKCKGIKKDAQQIAWNVFIQYQWDNFRTQLSEGNLSKVYMKEVTKFLYRKYNKAIVLLSGNTIPFLLLQLPLALPQPVEVSHRF